jgi:hypothetical protein
VATGSVGIETMMFGLRARIVSMSETWVSGWKPASVSAMTSIPIFPNWSRRPAICAADQSSPL